MNDIKEIIAETLKLETSIREYNRGTINVIESTIELMHGTLDDYDQLSGVYDRLALCYKTLGSFDDRKAIDACAFNVAKEKKEFENKISELADLMKACARR